jgi:hypothetical protein
MRRGWGVGPVFPNAAYRAPYSAPAVTPQSEVEILKEQANYFGEALESINKRIAELKAVKPEQKV